MNKGGLKLAELDWSVPDFSTLSRRQKGLNVVITYRPSTGALRLLIDNTGIKAEGEGEWFAKKHGPSRPRQWRKVYLGIDADTLEIRAIEVTAAGSVMPRCCPNCSARYLLTSPLEKSVQTALTILGRATMLLTRATPPLSYLPVKTHGHGWRQPQALMQGTKSSAPRAVWAAQYSGVGAGIIDEVWSKQRCTASSCSVSA
jgi:hypothetical protein